jgi:drug/metabolite transporter (DMT)-like permease
MKHKLTTPQYGVMLAIILSASFGDTLLKRGMDQIGAIDLHHLAPLFRAPLNPYIAGGVALLICFFACYTQALSWADLTFLMPATSLNYVVVALLGRFWLHEHLSVSRWAGIMLIVCAVGFVTGGPARTEHPSLDQMDSGVIL